MTEKDQNLTILEGVAKDVLDRLGYNAEISVVSNEKDPNLKILSVNSPEDSSILIGKNGQNISALEHVIRLLYFRKVTEGQADNIGLDVPVPKLPCLLRRSPQKSLGTCSQRPAQHRKRDGQHRHRDDQPLTFVVDVNDYRKLRVRQILDKAVETANRVITSKKAEALLPMSSYERRLIHVELASYPDIETESIGEEPERRVVIKPLII